MKISESTWYKLGALGLAFLVWYYVSLQELQEIVRRVPLTITLRNESLAIVGNPVKELSVTVSVSKHMVKTFSELELLAVHSIYLDHAVDNYTFRVMPGDIKLPLGQYRIRDIRPAEITVQIDQLRTVKLPVRVLLHGEPMVGYKVAKEEIQLDPEEVVLIGPKKKLDLLQEAETEPVDIIGRTRSFRKKVLIRPYVDIRPTNKIEIEVFIPIREEFGAKKFENVSVRVLGSPFEMIFAEVEPSTLTVEVAGPTRLMKDLEAEDLMVYVNVAGLDRGEHEVPFGYLLPQELSFKQALPTAKVKIGEVKIK